MKIGFIGLGNMGNPMARNLLKAGHTVQVYDVMPALLEKMVAAGASPAVSAQACAQDVDALITMLPSSPHVRSVYLGEAGVLKAVSKTTLLIDSSTIDPQTARDVAGEAGNLTFMVGASPSDFDRAKTILTAMGKNIFHCGGEGTGQVAKICNNMMLAIEMIATAEGMALATSLGMDPKVFASIVNTSSGRCWSSDTYNPYPGVFENAPASRGYTGGFGSDLMLKDLTLVTEAAKSAKQPVLLAAAAQQLYQMHSGNGNGALDFSSIIKLYKKVA
jgi:3-hydroxyisobutyrate dehydrogenase